MNKTQIQMVAQTLKEKDIVINKRNLLALPKRKWDEVSEWLCALTVSIHLVLYVFGRAASITLTQCSKLDIR